MAPAVYDFSELLQGVPPGAWVAISNDEKRVVAYAAEMRDAVKPQTMRANRPRSFCVFRYPQVHSCCKPCQNHVAYDPLHVLSLLAKLGVSERPRGTPADALIGTARLRYYAEVDSGADHCAFPLSFASQLGLDPLTNTNVTSSIGVGGSAPTFYWNATMVFGTVLSLDAYVGFTSGLEQQGMGL